MWKVMLLIHFRRLDFLCFYSLLVIELIKSSEFVLNLSAQFRTVEEIQVYLMRYHSSLCFGALEQPGSRKTHQNLEQTFKKRRVIAKDHLKDESKRQESCLYHVLSKLLFWVQTLRPESFGRILLKGTFSYYFTYLYYFTVSKCQTGTVL